MPSMPGAPWFWRTCFRARCRFARVSTRSSSVKSEATWAHQALQHQVHPVALPRPAQAGCQIRSRCSSPNTFVFHRSGLQPEPPDLLWPSADFSTASAPIAQRPASILWSTVEISRGKTRHCRCVDAGFTKCIPAADGGLRGYVPARPGGITPHIRFLFVTPQLRVQLPSDPASRQRPCRFPSLRLCENLAVGLPPT